MALLLFLRTTGNLGSVKPTDFEILPRVFVSFKSLKSLATFNVFDADLTSLTAENFNFTFVEDDEVDDVPCLVTLLLMALALASAELPLLPLSSFLATGGFKARSIVFVSERKRFHSSLL